MENRQRTFWISLVWIGISFGAAGWILGASEELVWAGLGVDAAYVLLCAAGVLLTGGILWWLTLVGRRLSLWIAMEVLLGASFVFGVSALWIMRLRGVVAFAVDSSGRYPEGLAYAAPVAVLAIMAVLWCPPVRKRLQRRHL